MPSTPHCPVGLKFFVLAKPGSTDLDQVLRNIYILYTDYVLKNPFYELDQPIRCSLFSQNIQSLSERFMSESSKRHG